MAEDPRRLFDAKDIQAAALYAKRVSDDLSDLYPVLVDEAGNLRVNLTVGTVTLSSTKVTIESASGLNVNVATATLGTVTITGTVTPSTTASTITNAVTNPVNVSLTSTAVTAALSTTKVTVESTDISKIASSIHDEGIATTTRGVLVLGRYDSTVPSAVDDGDAVPILTDASGRPRVLIQDIQTPSGDSAMDDTTDSVKTTPTTTASTINNAVGNPVNVSLTSTAVTVAGTVSLSSTAVSVTNSVSTIIMVGRTLTGSTGSISATTGTITVAPTNRVKIYAFSVTTTSATEVICIFHTGGLELWRVALMAPAGTNAGANLATTPPNFLFASRTGTAVSLSLSSAVLVHYSTSYFDEA